MEFNELVSPTLTELFVKDIQTKILSNQIKAGERLPTARDMAKKMKVSIAVINGGLSVLERQGFLEIVPRKGAFVADYRNEGTLETINAIIDYNGGQFDPDMMDSVFRVRRRFESDIAGLCAQNRTDEDLEALRKLIKNIENSKDVQIRSENGYAFYHRMAMASGNNIYPLLVHGFRNIYISIATVYCTIADEVGKSTFPKLRELLIAIERKDVEAAEKCDLEIIQLGQEILSERFSPGEEY